MIPVNEIYENQLGDFYDACRDAGRDGTPLADVVFELADRFDVVILDGEYGRAEKAWNEGRNAEARALRWFPRPEGGRFAYATADGGNGVHVRVADLRHGTVLAEELDDRTGDPVRSLGVFDSVDDVTRRLRLVGG